MDILNCQINSRSCFVLICINSFQEIFNLLLQICISLLVGLINTVNGCLQSGQVSRNFSNFIRKLLLSILLIYVGLAFRIQRTNYSLCIVEEYIGNSCQYNDIGLSEFLFFSTLSNNKIQSFDGVVYSFSLLLLFLRHILHLFFRLRFRQAYFVHNGRENLLGSFGSLLGFLICRLLKLCFDFCLTSRLQTIYDTGNIGRSDDCLHFIQCASFQIN